MTCPTSEPLDPRVRRTRKLLQGALRSLITETRYSSITVQDISERATVNRATFYAHYIDKNDLAISLFKTNLHESLQKRVPWKSSFNPKNLTEYAIGVFEYLADINDQCPGTAADMQNIIGATLQAEIYDMLDGWYSHSNSSATRFREVSSAAVVTVLSWSIYGGASRWACSKEREPVEKVCREIIGLIMPPKVVDTSNLTAVGH